MIVKDKTNIKVEITKQTLGLSGDVYIDDAHHIESLESHRELLSSYHFPSEATTIEEAEAERADFEAEMERRREQAAQELTLNDALDMLAELGVDTDDR